MPKPRASLNVGFGGNCGTGGRSEKYRGVPPGRKRNPDHHVGKDGYEPCPMCGRWTKVRIDGTLSNHTTTGLKGFNGGVPCIGAGSATIKKEKPMDGNLHIKDRTSES